MTHPLIVGAGPAGRSAALALLDGGLEPVLVDMRPEPLEAFAAAHRPDPKAVLVQAEAFHAEPGRIWLRGSGGVETRPFTHLVVATGQHPVALPDRSGVWHPAGALPDARLAALLGCTFAYDEEAGWIVPRTDPATLATSVDGVFVIGGARGVLDGPAAGEDGQRCAAAVLGAAPAGPAPDSTRRTGPAIRQAWSGPMAMDVPGETVICPCGDVTLADIRHAVAAGACDTHRLGRLSGAGEGECRGRRCALSVAAALVSCTGRPLPEVLSPPTEFPAASIPAAAFVEITRERPATFPLSRDEGPLS